MINLEDVINRLCKVQDILSTTNVLEDEETKSLLYETASDMLKTTAEMLRPNESVEVEDDEE